MLIVQKSVLWFSENLSGISGIYMLEPDFYAVFFQTLQNITCLVKNNTVVCLGFYLFAPLPHSPPHSLKPHIEAKNEEEGRQ